MVRRGPEFKGQWRPLRGTCIPIIDSHPLLVIVIYIVIGAPAPVPATVFGRFRFKQVAHLLFHRSLFFKNEAPTITMGQRVKQIFFFLIGRSPLLLFSHFIPSHRWTHC